MRPEGIGAAGLALGIAGVAGYFVVVYCLPWLPGIRNDPVASWLVVVAGLVLSLSAMARATAGRRVGPAVLLALNLVVAGAFGTLLYVTTVVPPASGPRVGAAAPDFALVDQAGKAVRLADFRGSPLLLVFYRGHW